jgi:pilus assembly protein CpaC
MIYGDVRELEMALKRLFPESSLKVIRLTNSLVLEGFVERPEAVSPIIRLAEDYAPKVINNISVGGVQQVLLKVKVMEVSRTKLRNLGFDFAQFSGTGQGVVSSISGLVSSYSMASQTVSTQLGEKVAFGVVDGGDAFFGFLDALQENKLAKILADPTITTVSGRPARFNSGGEFPVIVPSGLGQSTIEFKPFGTEVNFVPIVLGNGNIRLEVRPRISERDDANGVVQNGFAVPALKVREVDTGVELKAGQTLALAGLVQTKIDSQERGIPFLCNLPVVGAAFRTVKEEVNEVELLILVTPEFVDGMEPSEVPPCGPGMESVSPSNCQLYFGGHLEVPSCGLCSPYNACGNPDCQSCGNMDGMGYCGDGSLADPAMGESQNYESSGQGGATSIEPVPAESGMEGEPPVINEPYRNLPPAEPVGPGFTPTPSDPTTYRQPQRSGLSAEAATQQNPYVRTTATRPQTGTSTPGLIGPIGYDVE